MHNVTPIQELLLGSFAKPFFRAKSTALLVRKHERHTEYRHSTKRLENTENPRPDSSQIRQKSALALYEGKDVVGCAPTGAGKTMSFWITLLMH